MGLTVTTSTNYIATDNQDFIVVTGEPNSAKLVDGKAGDDMIFVTPGTVVQDTITNNSFINSAMSLDDPANWWIGSNALVADDSIPTVTVVGQGQGEVDWFSVTLAAGQTITLDADFADGAYGYVPFDSKLFLYDPGQNLAAQSFDASAEEGGAGSVSDKDPYVTYTAQASGTYYIAFGSGSQTLLEPVPSSARYILNVSVTGHSANDAQQSGYNASSQIQGGLGNDYLVGGWGQDSFRDTGGDDQFFGGGGSDIFYLGNNGVDFIDGGSGEDVLNLSEYANGLNISLAREVNQYALGASLTMHNVEDLSGSNYNDVLSGDSGSNRLTDAFGTNTLYGAGGDDFLSLDAGIADGGTGYDTLQLINTGGVFISAVTGQASGSAGTVSFTSIEHLIGTSGDDVMIAAGPGISLDGSGGNDVIYVGTGMAGTLDGGDESDLLDAGDFDGGGDLVYIDLADQVASFSTAILNFENANGTAGSDEIQGTVFANILDGGAGNDRVNGFGGDDTLRGGAGTDTVSYDVSGVGVTVSLAITITQDTGVGHQKLSGFENLFGSNYNDTLTGDAGANELDGWYGNDILDGGAGADILVGGAGDDQYWVDSPLDQVIETPYQGQGDDTVFTNLASYTLPTAVEQLTTFRTAGFAGTGNDAANVLTGWTGNDTLQGMGGDDTLAGGLGDDTLDGGDGSDTADYGAATGQVAVRLGVSGFQDTLGAGMDRLVNIENLTGSAYADTLVGNSGTNHLNGGAGADTMQGGKGDDFFVVDNANDKAIELDGEGSDTVDSSVTYSLAGQYIEVLNLTGHDAINGTGNSLANRIVGNDAANVLVGGDGSDRLDGGAGNDRLVGGLGNDTYVVDSTSDVIVENNGEGTDTVEAYFSYSIAGQYIEILRLMGSGDFTATGNSLANTLYGNAGNNTLNGAAGADTMYGGAGNDTYIVDDAGDRVFENAGEGTDTIQSSVTFSINGQYIENLTLTGSAAINGTGNSLANVMTGNGAANILNGGGGDDALHGGLGSDTLTGGAGADSYWFETAPGSTNVDTITDFNVADDTIVLDRTIFAGIAANGPLADAAWFEGTAAHDADDRIVYDKASGSLWYDADGNGAGAAVLFAHVAANTALTVADFVAVP